MIPRAECPEVGLLRDSESAGRRFRTLHSRLMLKSYRQLGHTLHHLVPLYKLAREVMTAPASPDTAPTPVSGPEILPP